MSVPTSSASIIEFERKRYINTWVDTIMKPDAAATNDPILRQPLTLLMRMLRESLCGKPEVKSLDEMIAIANSDDPAEVEFRFLMTWLSAPIQSPGRNLQTNLWLLGELGGSGKGTLNHVMGLIYGSANTVLLNGDEVQRGGWTDAIEDKLWICMNEINPDHRFDWNSFIKRNSTDDVVAIRKRNSHPHPALNFANWNFTTNNEGPACLDANDRRNALIATTSDRTKSDLAQQFRNWERQHASTMERVLGAFVYILHNQRINEALIEKAPDTLIKQEVQDATSRESEYLYWLRNDDDYPRNVWLKAHDYLSEYTRYTRKTDVLGPRRFGGQLSKLARKGHIQKRQQSTTNAAEYMVPSADFPASTPGFQAKTGSLLAMVPRK
jgi:hypothetical protein